jgi:hypothetical protein
MALFSLRLDSAVAESLSTFSRSRFCVVSEQDWVKVEQFAWAVQEGTGQSVTLA